MKSPSSLSIILIFLLMLPLNHAIAAGVTGYTGNVSNTGAGVSTGLGVNANASVNISYSVPNVMALGIYNSLGSNADGLFSSPTASFPGGTTFTSAESLGILVQSETNLNSKFDLDGTTSSADTTAIINLMQTSTNVASQDFLIKGALYTNAPASTTLRVITSTNTLTLSGGTGLAPRIDFRLLGGLPGGSGATKSSDTTPSTGGISITNARRNSSGFARIVLVGDIRENTVNTSTKGNWTGTFTLTLTGL